MTAEEYIVQELVDAKNRIKFYKSELEDVSTKFDNLETKYNKLYDFICKIMKVTKTDYTEKEAFRVSFESFSDAYSMDKDAMVFLKTVFSDRFVIEDSEE